MLEKDKETTPTTGGGGNDELEEYLATPDVTHIDDFDLHKYWKVKESTWPALSKMAKQYLAAPASSAGVERVFSAAGKTDARRPAQVDGGRVPQALPLPLFASFNTK